MLINSLVNTDADLVHGQHFSIVLCEVFHDEIVGRLKERSDRSNLCFFSHYIRVDNAVFGFGYILKSVDKSFRKLLVVRNNFSYLFGFLKLLTKF